MVSTETEVAASTSHGGSQPNVIDYNHSLFLNPSDVSGVQIISFQLTDLWDEFEALVPAPGCDCEKSKEFVVHLQKLKLFQFLMGLNESYVQAISQILLMSPLPSVNQGYAMIVSDESHRAGATSAGVLGVRPAAQVREFEMAINSRSQGQRLKKNYNVQCDFCNLKGHSRENCWKLNGYPSDFKTKRKQKLEGGAAYNVLASQMVEQDFHAKLRTGDQEKSEVHVSMMNQVSKAVFTQEQYSQILQMIHSNKPNQSHEEIGSADVANVAGISSVFFNSPKSKQWIIDTGATHHIVSELSMLDETSAVQPEGVKEGRSSVTEGNVVSNVLHIPQFSYNLLSVSKVVKEWQCSDLYTGKVRAIGRINGGLYFLADQRTKNSVKGEALVANSVEKKQQAEVDLLHKSAKQTRLSFPSSNIKTTCCFDLVHMDLWGAYRVLTMNGNEYFLTIVNDFSRVTWVFLLKFKTDVFVQMKHFLSYVQTQFNKTSCGYTPQQNGVAEKKHRHILECYIIKLHMKGCMGRSPTVIILELCGVCVMLKYLMSMIRMSPLEKMYFPFKEKNKALQEPQCVFPLGEQQYRATDTTTSSETIQVAPEIGDKVSDSANSQDTDLGSQNNQHEVTQEATDTDMSHKVQG
ncbi:hypothetical protein KY284_021531 [Solanum tuberosum]|nr:hypothetical protein KY284_021531 [Solanum tuberosum]